MDKIKKIKELLNHFEFEIESNYTAVDSTNAIKIKNCFIFYKPDKNMLIFSFDVTTRCDYSAFIISMFYNNISYTGIDKIFISDSYYDSNLGEFFGETAYSKYNQDLIDSIINDYNKQIKEFEALSKEYPTIIN